MRLTVASFCLVLIFLLPVASGKDDPAFESTVAPIFQDHCVKCHDEETRKGELDLSSPRGILRGGESGPVFQTGSAEESRLFQVVQHGEMPKKGEKLTPGQVEIIRHWIERGARFSSPPAMTHRERNQHDVLPIVLLRCAACHGRQLQENKLDLRTVAGMIEGGVSGSAIVPGDPDSSLMIQRIESEACPPQDKLLKFFVKRPTDTEVSVLREWIADGSPIEGNAEDVAGFAPDPLVSQEDRDHWAFRSPRKSSSGDSVDFFLERSLKEVSLDFAPEADRDTLIRRAYLDLVGMPPSVADWRKWRNLEEEDWFARMIDALLDSPHYGERWGRYWLDLAGYADSEGGLSSDPVREVAWKYRDYVVRAFDADKPYDRFLLEQIAGDELLDYENAEEITDEMVENLIATGFLRMGIDQTGSRTMNFVENRIGVIADAIEVLGAGVMGLTMECVRCHSHKYDPIPLRDYYRLKAVFQGAFDEHDWLSFKTRKLEVATDEQRRRVAEINPPLEKELKRLAALRKKKEIEWQAGVLRHHYPEQSEQDREATFVALKRADNTRSQEQRILVEKLQTVLLIPDEEQPGEMQQAMAAVRELDVQIENLQGKLEPPLAIRALWDRGEPSPTYILRRGEPTNPGRVVGPGVPSVLTDGKTPFDVKPPFPGGSQTGRRLALARWLTQPDHPLTARVLVNRVWYHHFGTGLVRTLENFGVKGEAPSHPELLDWLAVEFVERGWSIKELHRVIMNSRVYRQSGNASDAKRLRDPQNRLLSRMPLRRMDAEALRDSLLFVSGRLDPTPGGPPDGVIIDRDGQVVAKPSPRGDWRRSLYVRYRRTEIPTLMQTFDYPEMGPNCVTRSVSTVSPQSLLLMNNDRVRHLAESLARLVEVNAEEPGERIEFLYRVALTRDPNPEEKRLGVGALARLQQSWGGDESRALETYCHVILNSAAFIYVD